VRSLLGGKTGAPVAGAVEHEHRRELRTWLAAFVFVVRDCSVSLLREFLRGESTSTVERFFDTLAICVEYFQGSAVSVCREVTRTALLAVDLHLKPHVGVKKADVTVEAAIRVSVLLLKVNSYDDESMRLVFVVVRQFVAKFSALLFLSSSEYMGICGDLCLELLNLCDAASAATRDCAAALLYVLMRSNWETSERTQFFRSRMQTLIAVSKLTQRGTIEDYTRINGALQAISDAALSEYPPADAGMRRSQRAMSFATTLESKSALTPVAAAAAAAAAAAMPLGSSAQTAQGIAHAPTDASLASMSFGEQVESLVQRMFAVIRDNQVCV
jgi:hypothetical protein